MTMARMVRPTLTLARFGGASLISRRTVTSGVRLSRRMLTSEAAKTSQAESPPPLSASEGRDSVFKQQGTLKKSPFDKEPVVPVPWGHQPDASTFNPKYATEFRESQIPLAGNGWYAKEDIPAGVRMRRISIEAGSLIRIGSQEEFMATGWNPDEAVNYGIGHWMDPAAIFFLKPGTAVNHADPSREASVEYRHCEPGVMEIWTVKDIKAGEEMYCDYARDYAPCAWYDKLQNERGNIPLSQIPEYINNLYSE